MLAEYHNSSPPVFDRQHLARYTSGDAALEAELLALFRDQAERCLGLMSMASERGAWRAAVHTLKGSARGVGAFAVGQLCEDAEEANELVWEGARVQIAQAVDQALAATRTG